jgi:hypothetical protein
MLRLREVLPQSHGEHDFDILDASGDCVGILEVTMAANQGYVATMSAVFDSKRGSGVAPRRICNSCWAVTTAPDVRMAHVRSRLDEYLVAIERVGLTEFDATTRIPEVDAIRRDLRIRSGYLHSDDVEGRHFVAPPPITGWTDAAAVNKAVAAEAAKSDNLRKLSVSRHRERHLFVFVDMSSLGAHVALQHSAVSPEPPLVDPAITHVWAGSPQQGHIGVFWHATNGGQWERGEVSLLDWPDVASGI